ncbi:hypothetical protein [Rhodococcus sp. IEGM 1318]|uniref:hypothetical protein n=1 Tax=Rhodococcus sp. IEGM 1318 TaxID=3082226 RepID=UPI0029549B7C|nr:hypothetical protein [Rhodococcus sp. IEGM 1318]MDV8004838.1 hypothetical protein [Rhodococcus sp. IEGM 1318]
MPLTEVSTSDVLGYMARVLLLGDDKDRAAAYDAIQYNVQFLGKRKAVGTGRHTTSWR